MANEGATGGVKIARLEKGDRKRTALHADMMNEIIDKVNSLLSMSVSPDGAGKFIYADANTVLEIKATGSVTVTTGDTSEGSPVVVTDLAGVTTITFDQDLFTISNAGNGECYVDLKTEECP
jgi:hypothetical protein